MFVVLVLLPLSAALAQSTLRGGISLEHGYDSNINREPENEVYESTTTLSPSIDYVRKGRRTRFSLGYSPGFVYSYLTEDVRIDHHATAGYELALTRNLQMDFRNRFVRTEDPYEVGEGIEDSIEISDRRGRRSYWSNNFSASAAYTYGRQRVLEMGYQNRVLENREGAYSDYVRHSPFASVSHRINHQWETRLEYGFVRGKFDEPRDSDISEDLTTNSGDFYLYYSFTPHTRMFGHLGYSRTDYDEKLDDYAVYTASTGVDHQYSKTLSLSVDAGASLVSREYFSDTEALYLSAQIEKQWKLTSWYLNAGSGLDAQEFAGVDDLGLSRYWSVATGMDRTLMRNVKGNVDFSYRDDRYLEREPNVDEQQFEASAGLSWSFARWYKVFGRYTFVDQNADIEADNYADHRFSVGISAEKDLFRW
ncbi:MAG: outer membrane beta-barrel protein [Desulfobacteraceae bacterium]|nr:outer membrane beta-barrel protein [Desulfobacteraceae bacterium]